MPTEPSRCTKRRWPAPTNILCSEGRGRSDQVWFSHRLLRLSQETWTAHGRAGKVPPSHWLDSTRRISGIPDIVDAPSVRPVALGTFCRSRQREPPSGIASQLCVDGESTGVSLNPFPCKSERPEDLVYQIAVNAERIVWKDWVLPNTPFSSLPCMPSCSPPFNLHCPFHGGICVFTMAACMYITSRALVVVTASVSSYPLVSKHSSLTQTCSSS